MAIDAEGLRRELARRATRRVRMYQWDPYILGRSATLGFRDCTAREVAIFERKRWAKGRFVGIPGELSLCVADAVMSAQREYETAVRTAIRPFAVRWADEAFHEFAQLGWEEVFMGVYGRAPASGDKHYLSAEGRIRSIVRAAAVFSRAGVTSAKELRKAEPGSGRRHLLEAKVTKVRGIGPALFAYIGMNAGSLAMKLDGHVRGVLAPYLGLRPSDSAKAFEGALQSAGDLGMTPFEVDQVIWYTEAESGAASCR